jgi:hypothetical protein
MTVIGYKPSIKARKFHTCYWCGERIKKGEQYARWAWVENGVVDSIRVHPECKDAWHAAAEEEWGYYKTGPGDHCRGCMCERGWCQCQPETHQWNRCEPWLRWPREQAKAKAVETKQDPN